MDIKRINPPTLYDGAPVGLSQATVDPRSGLVFVSGQVDWDHELQVKHAHCEDQAEGAVQNLLTALAAAGSSAAEVLQLRVYVRGGPPRGARAHPRPAFRRRAAGGHRHRRGVAGVAADAGGNRGGGAGGGLRRPAQHAGLARCCGTC